LNDAERYSSIYVDDLSYKGFGGTIADNHYKHSLSDKKKWVSETGFLSPDDRLKFSRKFHRIVGRYFCHAKKGKNNARGLVCGLQFTVCGLRFTVYAPTVNHPPTVNCKL